MTGIGTVDSVKYGARLFAYLFAVLLVGGGTLGLGLALGYGEASDLVGTATLSEVSTTELAGGVVLAVLGAATLLSGLLGVAHKLIADSVAAGSETRPVTSQRSGTAPVGGTDETGPEAESVSEPGRDGSDRTGATGAGTTGPSPGEQAARLHGESTAVPAASGAPENPPQVTAGTGDTESGDPPAAEASAETSEKPDPPTGPGDSSGETDPAPGTADAMEPSGQTPEDAWTEETTTPEGSEPASTESAEQGPREPSPEEIAFGTSADAEGESGADPGGEDAPGADQSAEASSGTDETVEAASGTDAESEEPVEDAEETPSVDPAGRSSADPLADRTSDE